MWSNKANRGPIYDLAVSIISFFKVKGLLRFRVGSFSATVESLPIACETLKEYTYT